MTQKEIDFAFSGLKHLKCCECGKFISMNQCARSNQNIKSLLPEQKIEFICMRCDHDRHLKHALLYGTSITESR